MPATAQMLLQRAPPQQCGGGNIFTGVVISKADGDNKADAELEAKQKAKDDALTKYNQDHTRNCPSCSNKNRNSSEAPTDANTKKILTIQVSDTKWVSFHVAKYHAWLSCHGDRPANHPSAIVASETKVLKYGTGNPVCGTPEVESLKVYAGCVLGQAIDTSQSKAITKAKDVASKLAKVERQKILDTKACPDACWPGKATLDPSGIRGKRVLAKRIPQSKATRYVGYAVAYWSVEIRCPKRR